MTIEPEILETVDVQAGPGEATAGFGAVGGAIRFRTRNAVDMLQDGRDIGGIATAGCFSNDRYKLSGTVYGRIAGDIGILASDVHVNRDPYKDGDGVRQLATGRFAAMPIASGSSIIEHSHAPRRPVPLPLVTIANAGLRPCAECFEGFGPTLYGHRIGCFHRLALGFRTQPFV